MNTIWSPQAFSVVNWFVDGQNIKINNIGISIFSKDNLSLPCLDWTELSPLSLVGWDPVMFS